MTSSSMLHIRVDDTLKTDASETLGRMGLSVSDAVRMLLRRVVEDQALPTALTELSARAGGVREASGTFGSARNEPPSGIKELDVVRLLAEVTTEENNRLPIGTVGTIVHCYNSGRDFEVEFTEPASAVLTLQSDDVEVTWRS